MEKIQKTNAARLLDRAHITYRLIPYEVDESNLAATHVAESLGEDIGRVFKTIVLRAIAPDISFAWCRAMRKSISRKQPKP